MKNENYINVQGWMINDMELKGNELLIYAIIYGFTQDGESEYHGSMRYIAEALKITKGSVHSCMEKLLKKSLIEISTMDHKNGNKYRTCAVQKMNAKKVSRSKIGTQPVQKMNATRSKIGTNNNNTNNKTNNNIAKQSFAEKHKKEIPLVLEKFKEISPSLSYGNKTQRNAAAEMIEKYGIEETLRMVDQVLAIQGKKYAPRATTPHAMWQKIGDIAAYLKSEASSNRIVQI